jgi:phosphoglycerate dehydrogenase-like enzyme
MPNVIASPHSAGFSDANAAKVEEVFLDNLGRRLQGQPVRNVVG